MINREEELRVKRREYQREYYRKNKKRILEYSRIYYYLNKYGTDPPEKRTKEKPVFQIIPGPITIHFE